MRRRAVMLCVLAGGCRIGFDPITVDAPPAVWFDPAWSHRIRLTIDHTRVGAGGVQGFPVAVVLTDSHLQATARADGDDLRFTAADGVTLLAHELERYDGSTGELIAWVRVPTVSSVTDTDFFLYYGNPTALPFPEETQVWDQGFVAVYHLSESTGGTGAIRDSTVNANHASTLGGVTLALRGAIGDAVRFDGATGYLEAPHSASLEAISDAITLEAWILLRVPPTSMGIFPGIVQHWGGDTGGFGLFLGENGATGGDDVGIRTADGTAQDYLLAFSSWIPGTWYHVAGTWRAAPGPMHVLIDGAVVLSGPAANPSMVLLNEPLFIGGDPNGSITTLDGWIDEVRVSRVVRSPAWIETSHASQRAPSAFVTASAPMPAP